MSCDEEIIVAIVPFEQAFIKCIMLAFMYSKLILVNVNVCIP